MSAKMGCVTVVLAVFYVVGFALLGVGLWGVRRSAQAAHWPTVPGKVTELSVQEKPGGDDTSYQVEVRYAYAVDGVAYEGSRLAFGYNRSAERAGHDAIHRKLQEAKEVDVRYDPSDPAVSCLSFGMDNTLLITLVFSVVWLVFVTGFALLLWLSAGPDTVLLDNLSVK